MESQKKEIQAHLKAICLEMEKLRSREHALIRKTFGASIGKQKAQKQELEEIEAQKKQVIKAWTEAKKKLEKLEKRRI